MQESEILRMTGTEDESTLFNCSTREAQSSKWRIRRNAMHDASLSSEICNVPKVVSEWEKQYLSVYDRLQILPTI